MSQTASTRPLKLSKRREERKEKKKKASNPISFYFLTELSSRTTRLLLLQKFSRRRFLFVHSCKYISQPQLVIASRCYFRVWKLSGEYLDRRQPWWFCVLGRIGGSKSAERDVRYCLSCFISLFCFLSSFPFLSLLFSTL
jgi:hypothetical protein